ncbi:MAG TPA: penicillin acylase family protein, partial [Kofleriaceae bacterium]|nr:penicillin acylase family protein [Kofleriaceae bacterium]
MQVTGPTEFSAQLINSNAEVVWMATGGTVTPDRGLHVTFTPPPGTATGSLSATADALTASVQIASSPAVLDDKRIPTLTGPVKVQYDGQDIPHIQCAKAIDCIRVQGYVQAHDRLFPMDFLRHVARGHLAELIGLDGLSQDVQLRTIFTTRGGNRLEDELTAALDEQTRVLLTGFAEGVNAYLAELRATSAALPGEYRQLPFPLTPADLDDWTVQDTLAIGRLNQFQLSETLNSELANFKFQQTYGAGGKHPDPGRMAAYLRAASPPSERGHTLSATASHATASRPARRRGPAIDLSKWRGAADALARRTAELHDRLRPADASIGSNNWVVAASKSTALDAGSTPIR